MATPSKHPTAPGITADAKVRLAAEPASRREATPIDPDRRRRINETIDRVVEQHRDLFVALAKR
ncbi:MAG TPA: hypothetical protein VHC69_06770 [Polyangiaceae bacterium]|nr:hypothetical protein [Polyangiaceae bacterium]